MTDQRIVPSKWFYGLGILVIIAGSIFSIFLLISEFSKTAEESIQIMVPGSGDLELPVKGTYTIFYENQSVVGGKVYLTGEDISGLKIEVINKTTGSKVATHPPSGSTTYSMGGRTGRSILAFDIDQPGIYELSANYTKGKEGPEIVLAIFTRNIFSKAATSALIYIASIALGALIIIFTYIKRRNSTKIEKEQI
jgi:hypothetical protein